MCKAQEYEKLQKSGMTISEIAREYGVSRQCVSEALIKLHGPTGNYSGANSVQYPAIKRWMQNNHCSFVDFEQRCGCRLQKALKYGHGMTKHKIDAILRVTGLTYEQAFAK